jgi:hypothetical protein
VFLVWKQETAVVLLKPHDIAVALKYGTTMLNIPEGEFVASQYSIRWLAVQLDISFGEISKSQKRLLATKLLVKSDNVAQLNYQLAINNMEEWINHGIRYYSTVENQGVGRGVPTSWACPELHSDMVVPEIPQVWLMPDGDVVGEGISPLYDRAPKAALKDKYLYQCLALIDALRLGKPREIKIAQNLVRELMEKIKNAQYKIQP